MTVDEGMGQPRAAGKTWHILRLTLEMVKHNVPVSVLACHNSPPNLCRSAIKTYRRRMAKFSYITYPLCPPWGHLNAHWKAQSRGVSGSSEGEEAFPFPLLPWDCLCLSCPVSSARPGLFCKQPCHSSSSPSSSSSPPKWSQAYSRCEEQEEGKIFEQQSLICSSIRLCFAPPLLGKRWGNAR